MTALPFLSGTHQKAGSEASGGGVYSVICNLTNGFATSFWLLGHAPDFINIQLDPTRAWPRAADSVHP